MARKAVVVYALVDKDGTVMCYSSERYDVEQEQEWFEQHDRAGGHSPYTVVDCIGALED